MDQLNHGLREMLTAKALELFADYQVTCELADDVAASGQRLCGILGFTGDRLCGSVVISATDSAVASSNPLKDGATRGWMAELTNQLVGRFKNSLYRAGVEVAMSIPVVLQATAVTPMPQSQIQPVCLSVGGAALSIWLEIEAQPGLELSEPGAESEMAAEGEALMF